MTKLHYFLVAGEVVFISLETGEPGSMRLNTVSKTEDGNFTARDIGKAQQALQMLFFKRLKDVSQIKVVDVFTFAVSHLGKMTDEEFNAPPEGMTLQEVDTSSVMN